MSENRKSLRLMKKAQEQKVEIKKPAEKPNKISDKRESVNAIDVEDKMELERREAYIEPETRDLLRTLLLEGDKKEIIPVYSPGIGFVYQVTGNASSKNETGAGFKRLFGKPRAFRFTSKKLF